MVMHERRMQGKFIMWWRYLSLSPNNLLSTKPEADFLAPSLSASCKQVDSSMLMTLLKRMQYCFRMRAIICCMIKPQAINVEIWNRPHLLVVKVKVKY
jgi:hypothetical protein